MAEVMTLLEVVRGLPSLPDRGSIYAERVDGHFTERSPALVADPDAIVRVSADGRVTQIIEGKEWEHVITAAAAKRAVQVLGEWSGTVQPNAEQALEAILHYAREGSFLPVGDYFNREHAVAFDCGARWDSITPDPVLFAGEHRALLAFYIEEVEQGLCPPVAVLELIGFRAARLGLPGEDALHGHPLWGRGLRAGGAFIVLNSAWVAEESRRAGGEPPRTDDGPRPEGQSGGLSGGADPRHYVLSFHDSTFECLARAVRLKATVFSISDALDLLLTPS